MMHRLRTIFFILALSGSLYKTFFGSSVKCELMTKYFQTELDKFGRFPTSLVLFSDSSLPASSSPDPTKHKIVLLRGVVNKRAPSSENAQKHEIESRQSAPSIDLRIDPTNQLLLDSVSHVRLEATTILAVKELE
jgi:hypothetical protein